MDCAASLKEHRVLMLGAGMVSGPVVQYFALNKRVSLTAVSAVQSDLNKLQSIGSNVKTVLCDVQKDSDHLDVLIKQHHIVISLLPTPLHLQVAKMCIRRNRTNMLTCSYVTPEMMSLHDEGVAAGVTIMNECGLDPGIDHMLAMQCIDQAHENHSKVTSFVSYCGGLPAPECSDNALRYKFSWAPRGMLLAQSYAAKYLKEGNVIDVPEDSSMDSWKRMDFMPGFNLIGYPNRDSTIYAKLYGIENECRTVFRGTLRYSGFVEAMRGLRKLNLLSTENSAVFEPKDRDKTTWKELTAATLNQRADISSERLRSMAKEYFSTECLDEFQAIDSLGLLDDNVIVNLRGNPLDTLVDYLQNKLAYEEGERDVVIMHHNVQMQNSQRHKYEHRIQLVDYGHPDGYSAMARTVGYTAAIVTELILNSEIERKGMVLPLTKDIYQPTLKRLSMMGITARSQVIRLSN